MSPGFRTKARSGILRLAIVSLSFHSARSHGWEEISRSTPRKDASLLLWSTISNELSGRDGHASPIKNSTLSDRGRPAASVPGPNSELGQDDSLGLEGDSWLSDGPLDSLKSP